MRGDVSSTTPKKQQLLRSAYLAIYSRTVVRQFLYVRRSYDIDTTPLALHETWRTSDWRKYERKSATYLHMSYDLKGELNLYNKCQSDDLFHIVINENHPRGNRF